MLFIPDKDISTAADKLVKVLPKANLPPDLTNFLEFVLSMISQEKPVQVFLHERHRPLNQVADLLGLDVEDMLASARQGKLRLDHRGFVDLAEAAERFCGGNICQTP